MSTVVDSRLQSRTRLDAVDTFRDFPFSSDFNPDRYQAWELGWLVGVG